MLRLNDNSHNRMIVNNCVNFDEMSFAGISHPSRLAGVPQSPVAYVACGGVAANRSCFTAYKYVAGKIFQLV